MTRPQSVKRVLLVGTFRSEVALERSYLRAFRAAGVPTVDTYDLEARPTANAFRGLPGRIADRVLGELTLFRRGNLLARFLEEGEMSYDLILVFKGRGLRRKALDEARARQPKAIWANLNPDDPFNLETPGSSSHDIVNALSFFDLHLTWSRQLEKKLAVASGRRTAYLPFGYDPDAHFEPREAALGSSGTVCFIGSWDRGREALLGELAEFRLTLYGTGWGKLTKGSPLKRFAIDGEVGGEALCRPIAEAAVSLNILRPQNCGSHNMRTFEIPAAGGLLLTNRTPEQEAWLPDGEACLMYESVGELTECIRLCLSDRAKALRIRNEGRRRIKQHTYEARARKIMEEVELIRMSNDGN